MNSSRELEIAVIGAGIAGLAAARALQLAGFRVRVFEQAAVLGEVGAGLSISPNAAHALNALGLEQRLQEIGMQPRSGAVKHWQTGEVLVAIERGESMKLKYGAPYYQVHRADLHEALVTAVRDHDATAITLGTRFETLIERGGRVQLRFADGSSAEADVAIGADGLRSPLRAALFGESQPRFTGHVAWRGLVPFETLPPGIIEPQSCISLGPGHTFTRYLLRQGRTVNYVGLADQGDWKVESWSVRSEVSELLAEFADWYPELRTLIAATPPELCFKWALFDREPLPTWVKGHATLVGDAAHPMLPFLGQGAAMGLEDALILGRAFAAASSVPEALQRYEAARIERTTFVMLKSRETARRYHTTDPSTYAVTPHMSAESLGLLNYNPATVAV